MTYETSPIPKVQISNSASAPVQSGNASLPGTPSKSGSFQRKHRMTYKKFNETTRKILTDDIIKMPTLKPSFPRAVLEKENPENNDPNVFMYSYINSQKRSTRMWRLQLGLLTSDTLHCFSVRTDGALGDKLGTIELKDIIDAQMSSNRDDGEFKDGEFELTDVEGKTNRFCAVNKQKCELWLEKLTKQIEEVKNKKQLESHSMIKPESSCLYDLTESISIDFVTVNTNLYDDVIVHDRIVSTHLPWKTPFKLFLKEENSIRLFLSNSLVVWLKLGANHKIKKMSMCYLVDSKLIDTKKENCMGCDQKFDYDFKSLQEENDGIEKGSFFHSAHLFLFGLSCLFLGLCIPYLETTPILLYWTFSIVLFSFVSFFVVFRHFSLLKFSSANDTSLTSLSSKPLTKYEQTDIDDQVHDHAKHELNDMQLKQLERFRTKQRARAVFSYEITPLSLIQQPSVKEERNISGISNSTVAAAVADLNDENLVLMQRFMEEFDVKEITACRFLRARAFNYSIAADLYRDNLQLRKDILPFDIENVLTAVRFGAFHFSGLAKDGTVVVVCDSSRFTVKRSDPAAVLQLMMLSTNMILKANPNEAMTLLIDCKDFSLMKNVDFGIMGEVIKLLNVCIPEMLARVFVLNPPYAIKGVWQFCKGLLDQRTVEKVQFLLKTEFDILLDYIDSDVLESRFGGSSSYEFPVEHAQSSTRYDWKFGNLVCEDEEFDPAYYSERALRKFYNKFHNLADDAAATTIPKPSTDKTSIGGHQALAAADSVSHNSNSSIPPAAKNHNKSTLPSVTAENFDANSDHFDELGDNFSKLRNKNRDVDTENENGAEHTLSKSTNVTSVSSLSALSNKMKRTSFFGSNEDEDETPTTPNEVGTFVFSNEGLESMHEYDDDRKNKRKSFMSNIKKGMGGNIIGKK